MGWRNSAIILLLALSLLIWQAWRGGVISLALEHSPMAWLQCMLLVACANTAFNVALFKTQNQRFWILLSAALLYCALDERFMFHEQAQLFIYSRYFSPSPQAAFFVHAITLVYALGGLVCLYLMKSRAQKNTLKLILLAVFLGSGAVGLDIAFDSVAIQAYEEILEYLAETVFLVALINELSHLKQYQKRT